MARAASALATHLVVLLAEEEDDKGAQLFEFKLFNMNSSLLVASTFFHNMMGILIYYSPVLF